MQEDVSVQVWKDVEMKRSPLARKTPMRRVHATPRTHKLVVRLRGMEDEYADMLGI